MGMTLSAIERMTPEERATFSKTELRARKDDLAQVHAGAMTLKRAQERAEQRRKPWGLTANQVASLLRK